MKRYLPFLIVAGIFLLAAAGGASLFYLKRQAMEAAAAKTSVGQPGAERPPAPGAQPPHVRGGAQAHVTLEEFGDFECPPCGNLSSTLEKIEQDYGARLRVVFREFPLAMHKHAFDAACAAEAAGLQGHFWEMHDLLYHNRFIWPRAGDVRATFSDYAKTLKLDVERFKNDMDSDRVKSRIVSDQQRGFSLGVNRTPVLFINDRRLPETSMNPLGLHEAVDVAMNGLPAKDDKSHGNK
jgi:protein-disulfide isomerase